MSAKRWISREAHRRLPLASAVRVLMAVGGGVLAATACSSSTGAQHDSASTTSAAHDSASTSVSHAGAPAASILSSRVDSTPDPATQARVHVVLADHGGPPVDWFVDGAVAVNGG